MSVFAIVQYTLTFGAAPGPALTQKRRVQLGNTTALPKVLQCKIYFFNSLLFRDASTFLVISRLGSLGVYQKAVYFYCCVVNVSLVKFTDFNFMIAYMNFMNNGQMGRGNENPTQHLP